MSEIEAEIKSHIYDGYMQIVSGRGLSDTWQVCGASFCSDEIIYCVYFEGVKPSPKWSEGVIG